ncbi:MAG: hypothetical protein AAFR46_12720 [Pseudomonadota bacterium]
MRPEACYAQFGWAALGRVAGLADWVDAVRPLATALAAAEAGGARRSGGTWYAGVNILPNGPDGAVPQGPPLPAALTGLVAQITGFAAWQWEPAQISVCYPGYPRPDPSERESAFRFRRDRDAAHLDGLLPTGPERRRHLREHHAFILGIPLVETDPEAAPLSVYEGSHRPVAETLSACFEGVAAEHWGEIDVTDAYHALRRRIFQAGRRKKLHARPGEAILLHRHMLHGVAPWRDGAAAPPEGRMIAYFRPDPAPGAPPDWWLGP